MEPTAVLTASRRVGPYGLRQLLGKSSVSMTWLAQDERSQIDVLLSMPRQALGTPAALDIWRQYAQRMARASAEGALPVLDVGADGLWPYVVVERQTLRTVSEVLEHEGWPDVEQAVGWILDAVTTLASWHESGSTHQDVGFHTLVVDASGRAAVLPPVFADGTPSKPPARDLALTGLLLHGLLLHRPAHDEPDLPTAAQALDTEIVRLPFNTPRPVHDALRAIVNRATERHPTRRFVSARGMIRALQGWKATEDGLASGATAQLLERVRHAGVLPALPGLAGRVANITSGTLSVDAMVEYLTEDPALTFELLRAATAATTRTGHDEGPVLSPRRAIHLMGMNGVGRAAAHLRPWPGGLSDERAVPLRRAVQRTRRAAFAAAALAPPGLHPEEPLVAALLQSLGSLLVLYHFPEEASQIQALREGGMSPDAAACAVLGTDESSLAQAVARHWWSWRDETLDLLRPVDPQRLHGALNHSTWLRALATAAAEALNTPTPPAQGGTVPPHLHAVAQRYSRWLGATAQELADAVASADQRIKGSGRSGRGDAAASTASPVARPAAPREVPHPMPSDGG